MLNENYSKYFKFNLYKFKLCNETYSFTTVCRLSILHRLLQLLDLHAHQFFFLVSFNLFLVMDGKCTLMSWHSSVLHKKCTVDSETYWQSLKHVYQETRRHPPESHCTHTDTQTHTDWWPVLLLRWIYNDHSCWRHQCEHTDTVRRCDISLSQFNVSLSYQLKSQTHWCLPVFLVTLTSRVCYNDH